MSRLMAILLAAALGVMTLALAVPRLAAAIVKFPGDPAVLLLLEGEQPTEEGLDRVQRSRLAALEWIDWSRLHLQLGLAHASRAEAFIEDEVERAIAFDEARDRLYRTLELRPGDPDAWFLLAQISHVLEDDEAAFFFVDQSYRHLPFDPATVDNRPALALQFWTRLDDEVRAMVKEDIAYGLRRASAGTVRGLVASPFGEAIFNELRDREDGEEIAEGLIRRIRIMEREERQRN